MLVENNRVEFKRELNDKLEKEIVGFLNYHEGGVLYVGVDDNGIPVGVEDVDATQLQASERIKNNIMPSTLGLFDVLIETMDDKKVIKIIVSSGQEKPYYIKRVGMTSSGCYIRVGSSTQPMDQKMIETTFAKRVRNSIKNIRSHRQDLTFSQLKIFYEEHGFELGDRFLDSLELKTKEGQLNYAAYLLADENGTSIKVAKYSGIDRYNLIENNEFGYCCLIKATMRVLDKLKVENRTLTKITGLAPRKEKKLIDETALREAVINAIIHNDYSNEIPPKVEIFANRVEITSAGGLVEGMTEEDLFSGMSAPRNKELMRVFKDLELVEHLGSGMARILKVYDKSAYQISRNFIRVVFEFEKEEKFYGRDQETTKKRPRNVQEMTTEKGMTKTQRDIIFLIREDENITIKELCKKLNRGNTKVKQELAELKKEGYISRQGATKNGRWIVLV